MSEDQPATPPTHLVPPISQPFPGSLTPGWNDPPSVQCNSPTTGAIGRTKLNKRVPFPLQQTTQVSTKPTAIVQPCQPVNPSPACGNIAVVHPLQYTTMNPTTSTSTRPPANIETHATLLREISHHSTAAPTMFVPAVPRQNENATASAVSSVQHL